MGSSSGKIGNVNYDYGNVFQGWGHVAKNLSQYRFFIQQLLRIYLLAPFKKSLIGALWLFIFPLLTVIIWIFLHGAGIVDPGETGMPYPVFVLIGTTIWSLFINIYKSSSQIIVDSGSLLVMNKFPYETLIVGRLLENIITFSIPLVINIAVLFLFGIKFTWLSLLFPLTLIPVLLFGLTIGLFVALLRVVAVDLCNVVDEGMKVLMYLTPIVYAPKIEIGWLTYIIDYNPLTYLIGLPRDILAKGQIYEPGSFLVWTGIVLILCPLMIRFYLYTKPRVLERLINN
ncbi:MAG: ABC transporter permease [Saprospiraceae bacterium]|nr:ABC transporter permease [Saprospiraceae bacterium]